MKRKIKRPFFERFIRALKNIFNPTKRIWRREVGSKKGIQRGYFE